jgi:signal transduction histidine kinase
MTMRKSFHREAYTILALVTLLFTAQLTIAQKVNEDSLLEVIKTTTYDTARVDAMQALSNYQIKHRMQDSLGLKTLGEARALAGKINYDQGILQCLLTTGNYYRGKNKWNSSMDAYYEIIERCKTVKDDSLRERSKMMAYNNLGGIFNINGDYQNSLSYRLKSLEIVEKLMPENYNNRAIIYLNIASDYRQLKIPSKGIEYLDKTAGLLTKLSGRLKMEFYNEYYENYISTDNTTKAISMLDSIQQGLSAFDLSDFQKLDFALMHAKLRGNHALKNQQNPDEALKQFTSSLDFARKLENNQEINESLFNIGQVYLEKKAYKEAIRYLQEAYDSSASQSLKNLAFKISGSLAEAYSSTGQHAKANTYLRKSLELQLEIYDEDKTGEVNFLEARYQSEKKENEITSLRLSNTEKELAVTKRNRLLLIGGISAAALLLILGLLYRSNRQGRMLAEKDQKLQQDQIKFLERQQQVVSLQSMINGQESERTRIAKDLHDGLSGMFSTVKMYFSTLQHEKEELKEHYTFTKSIELIDNAAEEIRRIAHNMMPEVLMKLGLVHAVQDMCGNISAGKLLQVQLQSYGMEKRLNASTEIMLYRIIQELLTNIMKHAQASAAIVQFNRTDQRLIVTVEDNGKGFSLMENDRRHHAGLDTIKSRVDYLNGNITIDSQQEVGTTVIMEFLINEE